MVKVLSVATVTVSGVSECSRGVVSEFVKWSEIGKSVEVSRPVGKGFSFQRMTFQFSSISRVANLADGGMKCTRNDTFSSMQKGT